MSDREVGVGSLIYPANVSLDGWTEDRDGAVAWAPPDDDVFASLTELMRSAGTYLYGRRMYETMAVWETDPALAAASRPMAEFARVWQAADKVVHSSTLAEPFTARTRIERQLDVRAIRDLKAAATADLVVGGPNLAAQCLAAGLVDEIVLYLWPIVLGGRAPALPAGDRTDLELIDEHRFRNGVLRLRYRVR